MGETMVAHQFVGSTFFAMRHSGELCGSNGLPLTPNSITILGRSQFLKTLTHPHLCSYLDVIRGKHERSIVVSEYHGCPLPRAPPSSLASTIRLAHQVVEALSYLNTHGLVHRCLCPDNILINAQGTAKLFNYGLYYMTGAGADVLFPIGGPKYTAPEVLLLRDRTPSGPKADVWSLGIILAELILGPLWPTLSLGQTLRRVLSLLHSDTSTLERLARDADRLAVLETLPEDVKDLINRCLRADPRIRPTPSQLLGHAVFTNSQLIDASPSATPLEPREKEWGCNPLSERPLSELYHLWRLAGGDLHAELKRQGLVRTKPPVLSLPNLILLEGTSFGRSRDQATLLDLRVVPLPLDTLVQRLAHLPLSAHYPLTLAETKTVVSEPENQSDAASLPLVIRERDTEYQFCRIVLCDRLLKGYPYQKAAILKEAHKDVPPLLRGKLWAVLLGVVGDIDSAYISIDKETVTATDRQIEVDIPRCHQYNELLSSREGHCKLKRVLKAWVVAHPRYVYWQGLDSLCAPFLYLNFNDEARAYACLAAFVPKYLHDFFLKDNSVVIKEYLLKFSQLITFHDPNLSCHLREIAFIPELFAIPWFLTMFSHVFPLHKIFHLWDKLLLGDASFPLYVGLAILRQLRDTLLASGFNECILLFSDLPEVDIERCVAECIELYCSTPRSVTHREHELKTPDRPRHDPLEINGVTVAELQVEVSPRISGSDLVELITTKFSRPKVFVVDVRNHQDYVEAAIPGSVNIPIAGVDLEADSITSAIPESPELSILFGNKGKIIVVGGDGIVDSSKMCSLLVQSGFVRVCCLHRGMSVLKSTGLLSSVLA